MATFIKGERRWQLVRDADGHRTYKLTTLVGSDTWDGPARVMNTPGLPLPGSFWEVALPGAAPLYIVGQIQFAGGNPSTGTDYKPGDVLTISGGTVNAEGYPATIIVTAVDDSGATLGTGSIIQASLQSGGLYDVAPPTPNSPSGGNGSAASFDLTMGVVGGDIDSYAQCKWEANVQQIVKDEPGNWWEVEQTFSTKPDQRCQHVGVEDPISLPQHISASTIRYTEEATYDRNGAPIVNSGFEVIRGPQVEFDCNRSSIKITQNVPSLQLALCESMKNTVNAYPLWGLPPRCIKLSDFTWERNFWGPCLLYFTRHFTFDTFITTVPFPSSYGAANPIIGVDSGGGGTMYRVGDVLDILGGVLAQGLSNNAQAIVTTVDPNTGAVQDAVIIQSGDYAAVGTSPVISPPPNPVTCVCFGVSQGNPYVLLNLNWAQQGGLKSISGFDHEIMDEGTKVLMGSWDSILRTRWVPLQMVRGQATNPNNPSHFTRFKDRNGENARITYSATMQGCPVRVAEYVGIGDLLFPVLPGAGYNVGDRLQVVGGTLVPGADPAVIVVLQIDNGGGIEQFGGCSLVEQGSYSVPPTNPVSVTPITQTAGTGAGFIMTWAGDRPNRKHLEKYQATDFLQLGITSDLEGPYA
jgi:hypothetical protein